MATKMKAPRGSGGASFAGEFYPTDKKGIVSVPPEAVATLREHGFSTDLSTPSKTDQQAEAEAWRVKFQELTDAVETAVDAANADPTNQELADKKVAAEKALADFTAQQ